MSERQFSDEERERLASEGDALDSGAYPLPDCDAVRRAVQAYGRAKPEDRAALRRLITRRHVELGCTEPLPASWKLRKV